MRFNTREQAGLALADELARILEAPCVVAGIPRGGVLVALPVAQRFEAPLCALHVRRVRAPGDAGLEDMTRDLLSTYGEFETDGTPFGAVDDDGGKVLDRTAVKALALTDREVEKAVAEMCWGLRLQARAYAGPSLYHYLPGLPVVIVDEGMATGLTMMAAIHQVRRHAGIQILVAVPSATRHAADTVGGMVERFVCPVITGEPDDVEQFPKDVPDVAEHAAWQAFKNEELHVHETTARVRRLQPVSRDDTAMRRILPGHTALTPLQGHPQRRNV